MSRLLATLTLLALGTVSVPHAMAAPPDEFQTSLVVGDGLNAPSGFEIAPDGRIFILECSGKIGSSRTGSCCRPRSRTCRRRAPATAG